MNFVKGNKNDAEFPERNEKKPYQELSYLCIHLTFYCNFFCRNINTFTFHSETAVHFLCKQRQGGSFYILWRLAMVQHHKWRKVYKLEIVKS